MNIGILAIALLFFYEGLRRASRFVIWLFQWKQSQAWLSTPGKIVESELQNISVPVGGRKSRNFDGSVRLGTAYIPKVLYEYRTNAEVFRSRQIFIGQQFPSSLRYANEFVEKYPTDKAVTVFYNPDRPEIAVLDRDRLKELLLYLVGGVIYILIGFAFLTQLLRE